ncbi:MAG: peroxiredoxin [Xanthomonadales bacterium]|nr:peroxiredoxin [Xanthomonadales bacterium]
MSIQVGDRIPAAQFAVMDDGVKNLTTEALFAGKKVVLFAVPGAFTPTCSAKHLPGFLEHAQALADKGVDRIACVSVNDVFVMNAWGKNQDVGDRITMLADGNGDFARALGLEMDATGFGMGHRCKRFALVAEDGVVTHLFVEPPGEFGVSSAEAVLAAL